mmetsp:Transcript_20450/g.28766  ORF Transcript_20450/g.28766 Transcript_20450/m.28766 type:complete len:390 (-) Transcript_20450:194-1363(-)
MEKNVRWHLLTCNCLVGVVVFAGFVSLFVLQSPTRSKVRHIFSITFAVFSVCLSLGFLILGYLVGMGVKKLQVKVTSKSSRSRKTANREQQTSKQQRFTLRLAVSFSVLYAAQAVTWVVVPEDLEAADTSTWSLVYHFLNVAGLIVIHCIYRPKVVALENRANANRNSGHSRKNTRSSGNNNPNSKHGKLKPTLMPRAHPKSSLEITGFHSGTKPVTNHNNNSFPGIGRVVAPLKDTQFVVKWFALDDDYNKTEFDSVLKLFQGTGGCDELIPCGRALLISLQQETTIQKGFIYRCPRNSDIDRFEDMISNQGSGDSADGSACQSAGDLLQKWEQLGERSGSFFALLLKVVVCRVPTLIATPFHHRLTCLQDPSWLLVLVGFPGLCCRS